MNSSIISRNFSLVGASSLITYKLRSLKTFKFFHRVENVELRRSWWLPALRTAVVALNAGQSRLQRHYRPERGASKGKPALRSARAGFENAYEEAL